MISNAMQRRHGRDDADVRGQDAGLRFPSLRPGLRIYCVGDVHGRSDLLDRIRAGVEADLAGRPIDQALTVMLGDYVDRGPDSRGVIDILSSGAFPTPIVPLRGNHEVMMMAFLNEAREMGAWRRFGGLETLQSYGVPTEAAALGVGFEETRKLFLESLPQRHIDFLQATQTHVGYDDYFFCHAGVRPGVALDAQAPRDLLWIRDDFLSWRGSFGKMIVHGHTPVAAPELRDNRINIDTRAFSSGRLTCLVLEEADQAILVTD